MYRTQVVIFSNNSELISLISGLQEDFFDRLDAFDIEHSATLPSSTAHRKYTVTLVGRDWPSDQISDIQNIINPGGILLLSGEYSRPEDASFFRVIDYRQFPLPDDLQDCMSQLQETKNLTTVDVQAVYLLFQQLGIDESSLLDALLERLY